MTRHISRAWNATNDFLTHVVECLWDWTKAATHAGLDEIFTVSLQAAARIRAAHEAAQSAPQEPCGCTETKVCPDCMW